MYLHHRGPSEELIFGACKVTYLRWSGNYIIKYSCYCWETVQFVPAVEHFGFYDVKR